MVLDNFKIRSDASPLELFDESIAQCENAASDHALRFVDSSGDSDYNRRAALYFTGAAEVLKKVRDAIFVQRLSIPAVPSSPQQTPRPPQDAESPGSS